MRDELVTIIIPSYNHVKYVSESLESVIKQTYRNIELIIINDGSTDNTHVKIMKMEKRLKERFVRYIYIHKKENEGVCKALNEGLALSEGRYIIPFSTDDVMFSDRVEKQVSFLRRHREYGMVYADMYVARTQEPIFSLYTLHGLWKYSMSTPFAEGYVLDWVLRHMIYIPAPTFCIRRECYDVVGIYDESLTCEDLDMTLRIAKSFKIGCIQECIGVKRYHGGNNGTRVDLAKSCVSKMKEKYNNDSMLTVEQRKVLFKSLDGWINTLEELERERN